MHFICKAITTTAVGDVFAHVGSLWQEIEGIEMLLTARSKSQVIPTQCETQRTVLAVGIDDDILETSLAVLQEFSHNADLVEIGLACPSDGPCELMGIIE